MLRKTSLIILSSFAMTLVSTHVSAAVVVPINTISFGMAETQPGFDISLALLGLMPGASNLNYVILNKELPVQAPGWTEQEIQPNYNFAFELGGRYHARDGSDVNLNWTHLNSNTSDSVSANGVDHFLGPDYEIGPDAIPIRNATGSAQFKYDVINLDGGQWVNFGTHVQMRFFGGLSNTYLREQVNATYTGDVLVGPFVGPFSTLQQVTANFTGIGPRFGLDLNYNTPWGITFLGESAVSALIGWSESKTNYVSSSQELIAEFGEVYNYQTIKDQTVTQVLPGFDAKLGMAYSHKLHGVTLTVAAGYQAAVYVNAISQYIPGSLAEDLSTGGIFVATMNHTLSNYSVHGPFAKATLDFA